MKMEYEQNLIAEKSKDNYFQALKFLDEGKLAYAKRHLKIAQEYGYKEKSVYLHLGIINKYRNNFENALDEFRKISGESEEQLWASYYTAGIFLILGNRKAALENYKMVLKDSKSFILTSLTLVELEKMKIFSNKVFSKLIAFGLQKIDTNKDSFQDRRAVALIKILQNDYSSAFIKLRNLIKEQPSNGELYRDMAYLRIKKNDNKLAVIALKKGLKILTLDYEMHTWLAKVYTKLDKLDDAIAILKIVVSFKSQNSSTYINLGNLYIKSGKRVAAIKSYKTILEKKPDYFPALANLATLYHESGELSIAKSYYEKATELMPENVTVLFNLGNLFYQIGDYFTSIKLFKMCLKIKPNFSIAAKNLEFVNMARICFPDEAPDENFGNPSQYYWIGVGSVLVMIFYSVLQGWF